MTMLLLVVALLATTADANSIRNRRAISEFSNNGAPPSIVISDTNSGPAQNDINSYKTMLEGLLRQLSAIEQKSNPSGVDASAELADDYQREYYTQAASDIVQKLLQYGALSAIVDAENAAFYDDTDGQTEQEASNGDDNMPLIRVKVEEIATNNSGDKNGEDEEPFTDEQAHEVLKMVIEELMDKFFADLKNTHVFVLGGESKKRQEEEEEESGETVVASGEDSSSSSEEDSNEYYYGDSDEEYDDYTIDSDDDAVIVVNKQVSTNIIRIPTATFVDAITKLLPTFRTYPAQLTQLTPLQIEDPRVYGEHGEPALTVPKPGSGTGSESAQPRVSSHSVNPIASVAPTAAASVVDTTRHSSEMRHYVFDLGHVLVCIAAALLILWALVQLWSMYRRRNEPAGVVGLAPAPAMALPPKVIPTSSIIPNIYATPPAVRHAAPTVAVNEEKPPVYVETPPKPEV